MGIVSQNNVIRILSGYNQWWLTRGVQKQFLKPTRRTAFSEVLELLRGGSVRTVYLAGPHRTGKTALLHQLIAQLIDDGTDPKQIVYMNFSHTFFSFLPMAQFYSTFAESICPDPEKRTFCFVDDAQLSPEWEKGVLALVRENPNVTVVVSSAIRPSSVPDGARLIHMPPISFYEYCQISRGRESITPEGFLPDSGLLGATTAELRSIARHVSGFKSCFMRYLYTGGFLNLVGESDDIRIQRMIQKSVVGDALLRDIGLCFNVRSCVELEKIFLYLCFECPNVISFEAVMREVDCVTRPTIEKYVGCLSQAGLLYQSLPYEFDGERCQKVQPKIYLADAAIHSSLLMLSDVRMTEDSLSRVVETAVYRHLRFFGPDSEEGIISYHRGRSAGKNIDMILDGRRRIFVDVRYDGEDRVSRRDAIIARSAQADLCLIITRSERLFGRSPELPENVFCVPASVFLFLIGHAKAAGRPLFEPR